MAPLLHASAAETFKLKVKLVASSCAGKYMLVVTLVIESLYKAQGVVVCQEVMLVMTSFRASTTRKCLLVTP